MSTWKCLISHHNRIIIMVPHVVMMYKMLNCNLFNCANFFHFFILFSLTTRLCLVWRLRAGAHQEKAAGGSLLGADLPHRGCVEEDASHRPQHVLSRGPGAHQCRQDPIFTGIVLFEAVCVQTWKNRHKFILTGLLIWILLRDGTNILCQCSVLACSFAERHG